jgi:hypothetical protein
MKKVVDLVDSAQHRSFKSIQHIFSQVKNKNYIPRFRKYISENGTPAQKFQEINNQVFSVFKRARNNFLIIHDCDLQRWAKNKARELDFEFKASNSWFSRFISFESTPLALFNDIYITWIHNEIK